MPEAVRQARTTGAEPTSEGGRPEAAWPAAIALVAVLALQVSLPERLVPGSRWVLPALETALLLPLVLGARYRHHTEARWARVVVIALVAVINAANVYALILLAYYLIRGSTAAGHQLILSSIYIWFT